jgi:hypothetical protein
LAPTARSALGKILAAHKDMDEFMADATDLVQVRRVLRQIVDVKVD